jgi:D-alanyl-D-alanine carboxypeptidase/D-alanyl-D-alanine-endopeptidase (penicillin-binding protein 4)
MKNIGIFCVITLTIASCSSVKNIAIDKDVERTFNQSSLFSNQFTGFSLYDIESNKFITGFNDTKKFTPASNTKILTMYATLKSFNDSLPGLLYEYVNETNWVRPIGDPTFLDNRFENQPMFKLLEQKDSICINWPNNEIRKYGNGWAWDDYKFEYQSARSWWPIYSNRVSISGKEDSLTITPKFFEAFAEISKKDSDVKTDRAVNYNVFKVNVPNDTSSYERSIPFESSKELLMKLLSDTLKKPVSISSKELTSPDTLYSQKLDEVLSLMMKVSDNLISEQLLILSAWKNGYTSIDPFIKHVKLIWLSELNEFVWVDGSGLSRYNLIAPVDQVRLLKKAHDEFGLDRLKNILAVGGESGTIKDWYSSEEPYIYAKTGTLSNNHNLSGFLKTKSGKWLIFSFMNNHYTVPTDTVKTEMQRLLENIRDSY